MKISSVIYGCKALELNKEEIDFFKQQNPMGLILFKRNIQNKQQVKNLVEQFKNCVDNSEPLILIDQEGGRVCRLNPPEWRLPPACKAFGDIYLNNKQEAMDSLKKNCNLIAQELLELGINTVCAPMLDVHFNYSNEIIGDRAFSSNVEIVCELGKIQAEEYIKLGINPIIKHIPGHGRATLDSHLDLPVLETSLSDLQNCDFKPFKALNNMPFAMTAHIKYNAIDSTEPATFSKHAIDIIRQEIGFKGLIMTDDLSMKALSGSFKERAEKSYNAGCDIILHCNGDMVEMQQIASACRYIV